MNKEFANWLSLSGDLTESADTGRIVCPSCGKGPIDFRFVGRGLFSSIGRWLRSLSDRPPLAGLSSGVVVLALNLRPRYI